MKFEFSKTYQTADGLKVQLFAIDEMLHGIYYNPGENYTSWKLTGEHEYKTLTLYREWPSITETINKEIDNCLRETGFNPERIYLGPDEWKEFCKDFSATFAGSFAVYREIQIYPDSNKGFKVIKHQSPLFNINPWGGLSQVASAAATNTVLQGQPSVYISPGNYQGIQQAISQSQTANQIAQNQNLMGQQKQFHSALANIGQSATQIASQPKIVASIPKKTAFQKIKHWFKN